MLMSVRVATILLAIGLSVASTPIAASDRPSVKFKYSLGDSTDQCPDEKAVRNSVAARLGYVPWSDRADRLIEVTLGLVDGVLRAEIVMRNKNGETTGTRELESAGNDCVELAEAVELAISIAIDPVGLGRSEDQERPTAVDEPPQPEPSPSPEPTPLQESDSAPPVKLSAAIGGLLAWGSAPSMAGGLNLQTRIGWEYASLALEGRLDFPVHEDVDPGQISTSQILGSVVPCFHYGLAIGCGVISAGALRASGEGLVDSKKATLPSLAAGARLGLELPLGSVFFIRGQADLLATLFQNTLRETGTDNVFWTTPPLSVALSLVVGITFYDGSAPPSPISNEE